MKKNKTGPKYWPLTIWDEVGTSTIDTEEVIDDIRRQKELDADADDYIRQPNT